MPETGLAAITLAPTRHGYELRILWEYEDKIPTAKKSEKEARRVFEELLAGTWKDGGSKEDGKNGRGVRTLLVDAEVGG